MSLFTVETIRALFTHMTAMLVALGGMVAIFVSRADPASSDTTAILAGFVGVALTFLFGGEIQARTARNQAQATAAAAAQNGHAVPLTPHE